MTDIFGEAGPMFEGGSGMEDVPTGGTPHEVHEPELPEVFPYDEERGDATTRAQSETREYAANNVTAAIPTSTSNSRRDRAASVRHSCGDGNSTPQRKTPSSLDTPTNVACLSSKPSDAVLHND